MSHAHSEALTVPFSDQRFTPLPAGRWNGETGVFIGPFSSERLAHYFAETVLAKHPNGTVACYVLRRDHEWFVDICKNTDEDRGPTSAG